MQIKLNKTERKLLQQIIDLQPPTKVKGRYNIVVTKAINSLFSKRLIKMGEDHLEISDPEKVQELLNQ